MAQIPNATFNLIFLGLGLPCVGEFVGLIIRAKRVSNCYIQKKKSAICACVRVCSTNLGFSVEKNCACVRLILVLVWGTYYVPDTYVPHFMIPGT